MSADPTAVAGIELGLMKLTLARIELGLSVEQAADRIGVARNTLARAERGERVQIAKAKQIADFYHLSVTDIWPLASKVTA